MEDIIIYNKKEFKRYKNTIYYASKDGEIFSSYAKKIIKPIIRTTHNKQYCYIDVYDEALKKQRHTNVHRIVYISWRNDIPDNIQINHINDDGLDNRLSNLYVGTQKENINDCIENCHRVGNIFYLTLFDKEKNEVKTFCPASNFIRYSGHPNKSGCVNRMFNKNWFKKKYEIIEFRKINNISEYQDVTTKSDECNFVG